MDFWRRLPNKALFFTLLIAWIALFQWLGNSTLGYARSHSLFYWLFRCYNPFPPEPVEGEEPHPIESPDAHGNLVPLVVLGLFWWKRKTLLAADLKAWWPGLLLVAAGLGLHLLGYAVQQPRISVVSMFAGLYGLMGLAWGPVWLRRSFFPFCLFAFSVPLGSLAEPLTCRLRLLVSVLVVLRDEQHRAGLCHAGIAGLAVVRGRRGEAGPHRNRDPQHLRLAAEIRPGARPPRRHHQEAVLQVDRPRAAVVPERRVERALAAAGRRHHLGRVGGRERRARARVRPSGVTGRAATAERSTRSPT